VVGILLLVIVGDAALSHNRIHGGVSIHGVDVGRMSIAQATTKIDGIVAAGAPQAATVTSPQQKWEVLPKEVGTKIDVRATIASAYATTRSGNFISNTFGRLKLYLAGTDIPLKGSVDSAKMTQVVDKIAKVLDHPPVNAGLKIENGNVSVVEGTPGMVVDQKQLEARLTELFLNLKSGTFAAPIVTAKPAISASETSTAVDAAKTMISAPVTLTSGTTSWDLTPDQIQSYMDFRVDGTGAQSTLAPYLSAKKAAAFFTQITGKIGAKPKDATWTTDGATATVVPGQTGKTLDSDQTAAALTAAALSSTNRTAAAVVKEAQPAITTEKAKSMGIVAKLGAFTTEFSGSANRISNVQHAASYINNTLLAPGKEFDFDTVVGERTAARGFKTAPAIVAGKLEDTLGGGICQVATTLFNAVFFAGLAVTERSNHSLYISHYPMGRDATVSWGGPALRWVNDTSDWVLVRTAYSDSSLTFVIYGTPQGRKVTYTTTSWFSIEPIVDKKTDVTTLPAGKTQIVDPGQTGRSVTVKRAVTQGGKVIHQDTFNSHYPMYPRLIDVGKGPTTTTTAKPTPGSTTTTTAKPTSTTTTTTAP
jgi:vancomycin resistance protein YoaR